MAREISPLVGVNVHLALRRRQDALDRMEGENNALRSSGFNMDAAGQPYWDRATWESYKQKFGHYPFGPENKPDGVASAPPWVKALCGIRLNPAERMGHVPG